MFHSNLPPTPALMVSRIEVWVTMEVIIKTTRPSMARRPLRSSACLVRPGTTGTCEVIESEKF